VGLLLTSKVKNECGKPRWNDIDKEKLICPQELSGNPTSSHLVGKHKDCGKGNAEFCLWIFVTFKNLIVLSQV
jgi:hypothetical protein